MITDKRYEVEVYFHDHLADNLIIGVHLPTEPYLTKCYHTASTRG